MVSNLLGAGSSEGQTGNVGYHPRLEEVRRVTCCSRAAYDKLLASSARVLCWQDPSRQGDILVSILIVGRSTRDG